MSVLLLVPFLLTLNFLLIFPIDLSATMLCKFWLVIILLTFYQINPVMQTIYTGLSNYNSIL